MRSIKTLAMGGVMVLSLVGASSVSAANWDPQNTNVTATQEGVSHFVGTGGSITCTSADMVLRASGAVATTVGTVNPVRFGNCSGPLNSAMTMTTFGDWHFIAVSTSTVNITATPTLTAGDPNNNKVATMHFGSPLNCDVTVTGEVSLPDNSWNAANHTLTINGATPFGVETSSICSVLGTHLTLIANLVVPAASIT